MRDRWLFRRLRRSPIAVLPGLVVLMAVAIGAEPAGEIVARLGNTDITVAELRDFVRSLDPAVRRQAAEDSQLMNRLVRLEIARMAVFREAKAKNWEQRPEVAAQLERARNQALVASYLASVTQPPDDFPSDAQLQQAYDLNRDSFMAPRQYRLQQIFIALPAGGDKKAEEAAQKKAEELGRKAKAKNANFDELARSNSDQKNVADLGWVPEPQIIPEVRGQIAGMSKGDISDPIRAADGWHIIRMIDTKPAAPRAFAEVKDTLKAMLRQRQAQENEKTYLAGLLERNPVSVNEIGLRQIFAASP